MNNDIAYYSILNSYILNLYAHYKKRKRSRTKTIWVADWLRRRESEGAFHKLYPEILTEDEDLYRNVIRMTPNQFQIILEKVTPLIKKKDTNFRKAISPAERLTATLRYLATGKMRLLLLQFHKNCLFF